MNTEKLYNPYKCGEWQNRVSDSFTSWKKEWMHRGDCSAPSGVICPYCDRKEELIKFQKGLREKRDVFSKEILDAHEKKWGILT